MSAIVRKLWRDLWQLQGQVITIALVVACGIASFVTMRSTYDSLLLSRDAYYEEFRFGDVFARLERAPASVRARLEAIPGVAQVYPRVVESAMIPMPQMARPATGTVVSLPPSGEPPLNALYLEEGRGLDPSRSDEVILLEAFAKAHGIEPGDQIPAVLGGTMRQLSVVGIGMSPEFVLTIPPGAMTFDPKQVAVLWMNREVVEAAYQMDGGFNDVVARLQPDADPTAVLEALDALLEPYGGTGALSPGQAALALPARRGDPAAAEHGDLRALHLPVRRRLLAQRGAVAARPPCSARRSPPSRPSATPTARWACTTSSWSR